MQNHVIESFLQYSISKVVTDDLRNKKILLQMIVEYVQLSLEISLLEIQFIVQHTSEYLGRADVFTEKNREGVSIFYCF